MNTRLRAEPVITVNAGITDYRPRAAPAPPEPDADRAEEGFDTAPAPAPAVPPPLPAPAAPGVAFTAALLSGAAPPRQVTLQEVLMRNGSDWVPPPSGYRLADRKI